MQLQITSSQSDDNCDKLPFVNKLHNSFGIDPIKLLSWNNALTSVVKDISVRKYNDEVRDHCKLYNNKTTKKINNTYSNSLQDPFHLELYQ